MPPTGCTVMMCSSYNNGGLLRVFHVQCIWAKFTCFIWIYWLLMWYFLFLSNFGICYKCTVSYRYLLLRIAIHIGAPVSAIYQCIVSALLVMLICRQLWTRSVPPLVLVMAWWLLRTKHYLNQCRFTVNLAIRNKCKWNLNSSVVFSVKKMHLENAICKMVAQLYKHKCNKVVVVSFYIS